MHLKLSTKNLVVYSIVFTCIGIIIGKIQYLPFSFDIVLAIQSMFLFAEWMREKDLFSNSLKNGGLSLIIYITTLICIYYISSNYLEFASRDYPLFPLCYICAFSGIVFLAIISNFFSKSKLISKTFGYLGQYSMRMLWIHCFDSNWQFAYNFCSNDYVTAVFRVLMDVVIFVIITLISNLIKMKKNERMCANMPL